MFKRAICVILLPVLMYAAEFEVPMGVSGNRLVLTVRNPDKIPLNDVHVTILRSPDWFVSESGLTVTLDSLKAGSSADVSFLFYADKGEAGRSGEVVLDVTDRTGQSLGRRVIGLKTSLRENRFTLFPAFPNPSNPAATIRFTLPESAQVRLEVFNVLGRRVCTLMHERKPAGLYDVTWEGKDERGIPVSAGEYLIQLVKETDRGTERRTAKLVLKK